MWEGEGEDDAMTIARERRTMMREAEPADRVLAIRQGLDDGIGIELFEMSGCGFQMRGVRAACLHAVDDHAAGRGEAAGLVAHIEDERVGNAEAANPQGDNEPAEDERFHQQEDANGSADVTHGCSSYRPNRICAESLVDDENPLFFRASNSAIRLSSVMRIRIGYDLAFDVPATTALVMMLYVHPDRVADLEQPDRISITPHVPIEDFTDNFGNRCARIVAPAGRLELRADTIIRDTGLGDARGVNLVQHKPEELLTHVLPFLLASRYCEVDRFQDIAWELFGEVPEGWPRVQAISDWVHNHLHFGYKFARPTKTAWDAYVEKTGVCRDFMHLAVTLTRCMNIPARYATGYLGDIGVPPDPAPMDFSAFYEVYLSGQWWPMDARHNVPRQGRIAMGFGRDAVDVALTTSFGSTQLKKFVVISEELK